MLPVTPAEEPSLVTTRVCRREPRPALRRPVDGQKHSFDLSGAVLHVDSRSAEIVEFWALDSGGPLVARAFSVVGTGHSYPDHWKYVGSVIVADGALVWHLMEVPA